ncbi:MAG: glucans biosynthesis glucosyltransferase MdoH [Bdellovibrionales bacterium]|nr:glucans biosynthesis glucosyltransferase MdoH [Bdellovibrionales bacterium]
MDVSLERSGALRRMTPLRTISSSFGATICRLRKACFWLVVVASVAWMSLRAAHVLEGVEHESLRAAILLLFVLCFTWIAIPFWLAVTGLLLTALRLDPVRGERRRPLHPAPERLSEKTAIVMPVYNETPERVYAALAAMYDEVEEKAPGIFDFFVLSDTRRPEVAERERELCVLLRKEGRARLYYRRREKNISKKAGNIAEFISRWGAAYESMIVLDADSIIAGDLLCRLAGMMESNPQAALIQTAPMIANAESLFGRMIQFACRLCGPVMTRGSVFLYGASANYWGHNAIIRLKPFAEHCGLGTLPGRPPLGGEILSHDFVEAALLSASGWGVYLLPDAHGSYEELPPTPIEYLQRDQRWSQGNLQHLKLVHKHGLRLHSRIFFLIGAFAYLSSPMWLSLLLLSTSDRIISKLSVHNYFPKSHQLFPEWPISRQEDAIALFTATVVVLFLPKAGAALLTFRSRRLRGAYGGAVQLFWSILLETLFFVVFAPTMMIFHSWFVVQTLSGRKVQWNPQNRSANGLRFLQAAAGTAWLSIIGVVWGAVLWMVDVAFLAWMSPIIIGLIVAPVLVWSSGSASLGQAAKREGLFLVPEETEPLPILSRVASENQRLETLHVATGEALDLAALLPAESGRIMHVSRVFTKGGRNSAQTGPIPVQAALQR